MFEKRGHHIIHHAKEWSLRPESRSIRETSSLIVPMDRKLHDEIHDNCPPIPLLGYHALARTVAAFEPERHPLASMENLMTAIEQASNHPKAHEIEKHLAELAIWAIDLQRPYVQEATKLRLVLA